MTKARNKWQACGFFGRYVCPLFFAVFITVTIPDRVISRAKQIRRVPSDAPLAKREPMIQPKAPEKAIAGVPFPSNASLEKFTHTEPEAENRYTSRFIPWEIICLCPSKSVSHRVKSPPEPTPIPESTDRTRARKKVRKCKAPSPP